jgi:hypothetical protein
MSEIIPQTMMRSDTIIKNLALLTKSMLSPGGINASIASPPVE